MTASEYAVSNGSGGSGAGGPGDRLKVALMSREADRSLSMCLT
jgi:hypothetical protein